MRRQKRRSAARLIGGRVGKETVMAKADARRASVWSPLALAGFLLLGIGSAHAERPRNGCPPCDCPPPPCVAAPVPPENAKQPPLHVGEEPSSRPDASVPVSSPPAEPDDAIADNRTLSLSSILIESPYMDGAIPGNLLRLRFEAAYHFLQPTRGEFFYAKGGSLRGPGLPLPETGIAYQQLSAYLEVAATERFSAFVEVPQRWLNPEVNANTEGFSDMNVGGKYAFIYRQDLVTAFQFRAYLPTGDARRGLGNNLVSLEPSLLLWKPLTDRLGFEAEFRYVVPIGGTDFAGNLIRYGAGLHYAVPLGGSWQVVPIAELAGWTFLNGKETFVTASGENTIRDASGDTILNVKFGARLKFGATTDFYMGYSRPLTGTRMYENGFRMEWRLVF
jgi:hypothetical protein